MRATTLLLTLSLVASLLALAPAAAAYDFPDERCLREGPPCGVDGPCLVGEPECVAHVQVRVCVTEPCEWLTVCVLHGQLCYVSG